MLEPILGNATAEKVLTYLENYGEGYASGIAKTFQIPVNMVQKQLARFENGGILVSRPLGNVRVFEFNRRNYFVKDLRSILAKALEAYPDEDIQKYFRNRTRPRRTGKPL